MGGRRGGQVLVGEEGPEIVDLPFGSHVNSNPDSRAMMAGKGARAEILTSTSTARYTATTTLYGVPWWI